VRTGDIVLLDSLFDNQYEHFRRSLSSASVDGVCATLNHACTVLEQDFREVLHSRVRAGFPSDYYFQQAYNMVQSSIQQGKLQSSDTEKTKAQFLVCIFLLYFTYVYTTSSVV
jgi:hypothetical protein